ncbi:MAG: VOC family protein [Saprospiraceae bacterium]|nr:VOC family protein [Saprospiraceae bacterium]
MHKMITGIQQIGVGVSKPDEALKWYIDKFGMDIKIFDDEAVAGLMLPYTGGQAWNRRAILAFNMQSGGGFEVWLHTQRTPLAPKFEVKLGDYGIFITKIKSQNVKAVYDDYKTRNIEILGELTKTPNGEDHFYVKDPYNNIFEIVHDDYKFMDDNKLTAGVSGCVIGVSDIEKSLTVYQYILGYDKVVYDVEDKFEEFSSISGGNEKFRRVLLRHSKERKGPFSKLYGPTQIELVQLIDKKGEKIFKDRFWGDLGFIHLCFDIIGMNDLRTECESKGFPFVADSRNSFDMGDAAGHFSYIEDPDGTLIEFVETTRVPILKKIGWYLNLEKRTPGKPLPNWMVKALKMNRVKS